MKNIPVEPTRAANGKKTFTILHTNDMHSNLIGVGPASDYTPNVINDDQTIGGFARVGTVIVERRKVRQGQGPVLVLDAGDYSMGTAFGAAIRQTGGELQLLFQMGYDATGVSRLQYHGLQKYAHYRRRHHGVEPRELSDQ